MKRPWKPRTGDRVFVLPPLLGCLRSFLLLVMAGLFLGACAIPLEISPLKVKIPEVGLASWYGRDFHGRPTSSGEIYNMFGISAAHKSFPMGTLLLVTDLQTGNEIEVKVNDRGPFVPRRILDLSYGAAKELGIVKTGVTRIRLKVIGQAPIYLPNSRVEKRFFVQVGSYRQRKNAEQLKDSVSVYYRNVFVLDVESASGPLFRVRVGPYRTKSDAEEIVRGLQGKTEFGRKISPLIVVNK